MPKMTGKFTTGTNKGRQYEIYQDPASDTGYTRKNWDENDPNRTEYFEPYNYAAAQVDDEAAQMSAANSAANSAARAARATSANDRAAKFEYEKQRANERNFQEGVRQYNEGAGLKRDDMGLRRDQFGLDRENAVADRGIKKQDLKLRELDTRTRLQIGLRELELNEQKFGADDMRSRERNVMDYVKSIGQLRLPYAELQALSQRAVAGIIPGGAAPGGGAPSGGGALTADQWQALAQGVSRDWEQRQIGQGSALAG